MKLSEEDAELFFKLMWPLQYFVNQKLGVLPNIKNIDEYIELELEEKIHVRDALYKNKELIDSFVKENPQNFSEEELAIISEWKNFVEGDFHIERFLKKYAIFIQGKEVYGVLGLYDGFDEFIHPSYLPFYIKAVLLPFKGRIVYDGIIRSYNVYFGSGIKGDLKEHYMAAKQNHRIIESLEVTPKKNQKKKAPLKSWKLELKKLADTANKLKGSSDSPAIHSPAFSLVRASIEFAQLAESNPEDLDELYKVLKKAERALNKSYITLDRQDS